MYIVFGRVILFYTLRSTGLVNNYIGMYSLRLYILHGTSIYEIGKLFQLLFNGCEDNKTVKVIFNKV